jgi:Leucine-rich repeat (LRR) protein
MRAFTGERVTGIHISNALLSEIETACIESFRHLKSLQLVNANFVTNSGKWLRSLDNLADVSFRLSNADDRLCETLSELHRLESVDLSNTQVTDLTLERLGGLALKEVFLEDCDITAQSTAVLGRMPSLEMINCSGTLLRGADFSAICALNKLRHLNISRSSISDEEFSDLSFPPSISYLDLSDTSIADITLIKAMKLPQLQCLDISRTSITGGPGGVKQNSSLRYLSLDSTRVDEHFYKELNLPSLEILSIRNCHIGDEILKWLRTLTSLKRICIEGTNLNAEQVRLALGNLTVEA